jgi:hypothetical protein
MFYHRFAKHKLASPFCVLINKESDKEHETQTQSPTYTFQKSATACMKIQSALVDKFR